MSSKPSTEGSAYAQRLAGLQLAWWKRIVPVQAPYRWHLRRLRLGATLDVGCGLGRNLGHLGDEAVGVDHNVDLVNAARAQGHNAFSADEFASSGAAREGAFDSILFSHVLEHMTAVAAEDLLRTHLPYLKTGGRVIVITPQERGFASDPTHVSFLGFHEVERIFRNCGVEPTRTYSFPFPRRLGTSFVYNEFVSIGVHR